MIAHRFIVLTVADVVVSADVSWIAVVPLLLWTFSQVLMPMLAPEISEVAYWGMALAATCGIALSLLLRELIYIIVSRRLKVPLRAVNILFFGGVSDAPPGTVTAELKATAAGAIASLTLGVLFFALFVLQASPAVPLAALSVALVLMGFNWAIAAADVIPVFPLHAGRILRSALLRWTKNAGLATATARLTGGGIAVAIASAGGWLIASGSGVAGLWLMIIGLLICRVTLFHQPRSFALERDRKARNLMQTPSGPVTHRCRGKSNQKEAQSPPTSERTDGERK